jgi:hypothetical protein
MERRRKFSLTASVIAPEASVTSVADCRWRARLSAARLFCAGTVGAGAAVDR